MLATAPWVATNGSLRSAAGWLPAVEGRSTRAVGDDSPGLSALGYRAASPPKAAHLELPRPGVLLQGNVDLLRAPIGVREVGRQLEVGVRQVEIT